MFTRILIFMISIGFHFVLSRSPQWQRHQTHPAWCLPKTQNDRNAPQVTKRATIWTFGLTIRIIRSTSPDFSTLGYLVNLIRLIFLYITTLSMLRTGKYCLDLDMRLNMYWNSFLIFPRGWSWRRGRRRWVWGVGVRLSKMYLEVELQCLNLRPRATTEPVIMHGKDSP